MIILDTNILRSFALDSATTDLLMTIRTVGAENVAVPWVVLEELVAQRAIPFREKYEAAQAALDSVRRAAPWDVQAHLPPLDLERVHDHWRNEYLGVVDSIPTSEAALREATTREANSLPPCKAVQAGDRREKVKTGGRDAAIWLTAVEYARDHPDETVYFVSNNTKDFGNGTTYSHPMDLDLSGIGEHFVHLTSLGAVLKRFTEETDLAEEQAVAALTSEATRDVVADAVTAMLNSSRRRTHQFEVTLGYGSEDLDTQLIEMASSEATQARVWACTWRTALHHVTDVKAYRIGDRVWYTATVEWMVTGVAVTNGFPVPTGFYPAAFSWETRMLIPEDPSVTPTILRNHPPRPLHPGELHILKADFPSLAIESERDDLPRPYDVLRFMHVPSPAELAMIQALDQAEEAE
ncbi:PIN domain-containing protein [Streptomyces decoyicus]|uniref:PIN domain-containing protein n=1 Tax=Streptomyces decoyicus TaxID=249567 RepID=UPI0033EBA0EF